MDLGVHLPLMPFGEERLSLGRLGKAVDTARECGFAAVSALYRDAFTETSRARPLAHAPLAGPPNPWDIGNPAGGIAQRG